MGGEEKFVFQRIFDFSDYKEKPRHVERINYNDTRHFILNVHYAQRMPSISYAFGLFVSGQLTGVCTFGSPASHYLCKGICGDNFYSEVLELNRLVLLNNKKMKLVFLFRNHLNYCQSLKLLLATQTLNMNISGRYIKQLISYLQGQQKNGLTLQVILENTQDIITVI